MLVEVRHNGARLVAASSTITRPENTTAYASGDLVANSVTASEVNALQFQGFDAGAAGEVLGARIQKSTNSATNAAFRLHLSTVIPTFATNGDNDAISTNTVMTAKGWLGYVDITAMTGFSAVAWGAGAVDSSRLLLPYVLATTIIYGVLEARGSYTPGSAEVFTLWLIAR